MSLKRDHHVAAYLSNVTNVLQFHPSLTGVFLPALPAPAPAIWITGAVKGARPVNSPLSQILLWGDKGRCKLCELTITFAALSPSLPPLLHNQLRHEVRRSSYRTSHLRFLYLRRDLPILGQQKTSHGEVIWSFGLTSHERRNSSQELERRRFGHNGGWERIEESVSRWSWRRFLSTSVLFCD